MYVIGRTVDNKMTVITSEPQPKIKKMNWFNRLRFLNFNKRIERFMRTDFDVVVFDFDVDEDIQTEMLTQYPKWVFPTEEAASKKLKEMDKANIENGRKQNVSGVINSLTDPNGFDLHVVKIIN